MVEAIVKIAKGDLEIQQALEIPVISSAQHVRNHVSHTSDNYSVDLLDSTQPSEDDGASPQKLKETIELNDLDHSRIEAN